MRKHLTPSLVISLIALFVALGGASYAAVKIPKNSVGASQLKKNAVDSSKVRDRSLLAEDFKAGQLPRGEQGPKGDTGATGATGPTGPAGPTFSFSYSESVTPVTINSGYTGVVNQNITVPNSGRLVANFTGRIVVSSGSAGPPPETAQAICVADVIPPGGSFSQASQEIPSSPAVVASGGNSQHGTITLTFGYNVAAAGTYNIAISCFRRNIVGTPTLQFDRYDMTGVLTGA